MVLLIILIFIIGYLAIAAEHPLKLNKAASALLTGGLCWTILIFFHADTEAVNADLLHHLGEIASIVFFLLGAMTIVELIDSHGGFEIVTNSLHTRNKSRLLLILSTITFFLSALLDNLTTAIVMTSLCAKLLDDRNDRLYFAGLIIISANAGGAWSPLGDVTTTMLWIGGQLTAMNVIVSLIIPSLVVGILPTLMMMYKFRGQSINVDRDASSYNGDRKDGKYILLLGICLLLFVPLFKSVSHLPPFMGMLIALGVMWIFITILHAKHSHHPERQDSVATALRRIDTPSILFFLGILLAVSALQSAGILNSAADFLTAQLHNDYLIGMTLGLLSALVDNVPLVAAAQGMYDLQTYPPDHLFWEFLALTTGTGGSTIIIGSAAGVAAMGIEKINFMWYLKRISLLALIGYFAGVAAYIAQQSLLL